MEDNDAAGLDMRRDATKHSGRIGLELKHVSPEHRIERLIERKPCWVAFDERYVAQPAPAYSGRKPAGFAMECRLTA